MEIKCNFYPNTSYPNHIFSKNIDSYRQVNPPITFEGKDVFTPMISAVQKRSGFFDYTGKFISGIANGLKTYKKNIEHTYEHKIYFSIIEKELFGTHSIDSITHDADKMIMYILGFPKDFVSKFHRKHSAHHFESGKKFNLHSMLCDNIASSPQFKPEKKMSMREYYNSSKELQSIPGFGEILEQYNFGENLDFAKIKRMKNAKYSGSQGFVHVAASILSLLFHV